jgi:hypothetical protein
MNRTELKNRLYHRRCVNCGFLGAVRLPDSSRALPDLEEVTANPSMYWKRLLQDARQMGKLHGSEFDPVMGQDLGLDEVTPHGVMCGLGRPEGLHNPVFFMVPPRSSNEGEPAPPLPPRFQVRETTDLSRGIGRVIATIQTFVWPLVRPHTCPAYLKYREGLTPVQHVEWREGVRRWRRDAVVGLVGIALGVVLNRLLGG